MAYYCSSNSPTSAILAWSIVVVVLLWEASTGVWAFRDSRLAVSQFYEFEEDSSLQPLGPCSGQSVATPKWPVYAQEAWIPHQSSCPWETFIDEDFQGNRFPCRIRTVRLTLGNPLPGQRFTIRPQPCLRRPGHQGGRIHNRFCQPLLRDVPVAIQVGNRRDRYVQRNITIAVGFTCAFQPM